MNSTPKNFSNRRIALKDRPGVGLAFYKCRHLPLGGCWMAWAALVPMTEASGPGLELTRTWFDFGDTEAEAIRNVQLQVQGIIGKTEWQRQEL